MAASSGVTNTTAWGADERLLILKEMFNIAHQESVKTTMTEAEAKKTGDDRPYRVSQQLVCLLRRPFTDRVRSTIAKLPRVVE